VIRHFTLDHPFLCPPVVVLGRVPLSQSGRLAATMDSEALPVIIEHIQASRYVSAAGLVVLLYDHLLTFDQELQLIWRAKTTLPKLLFLFNRYTVPIAMIIRTNDLSGIALPVLSNT